MEGSPKPDDPAELETAGEVIENKNPTAKVDGKDPLST